MEKSLTVEVPDRVKRMLVGKLQKSKSVIIIGETEVGKQEFISELVDEIGKDYKVMLRKDKVGKGDLGALKDVNVGVVLDALRAEVHGYVSEELRGNEVADIMSTLGEGNMYLTSFHGRDAVEMYEWLKERIRMDVNNVDVEDTHKYINYGVELRQSLLGQDLVSYVSKVVRFMPDEHVVLYEQNYNL